MSWPIGPELGGGAGGAAAATAATAAEVLEEEEPHGDAGMQEILLETYDMAEEMGRQASSMLKPPGLKWEPVGSERPGTGIDTNNPAQCLDSLRLCGKEGVKGIQCPRLFTKRTTRLLGHLEG